MTNYNERLDETVERIRRGMHRELGGTSPHLEAGYTRVEARQAITSLIKELVAEAKPTNSESQRGSVTVYGDLSERDLNIIDQFEQNLLKALEEV